MCGFALYCLPNDDNNNWNPLSDNNIVFRDFSASTCHVCNFFDKTAFFFLTVYTSIEIILDDKYTDNIRQVNHVNVYILVKILFLALLVRLNISYFLLIASKTITYTLFDIIRIKIKLYNELLQ